MEGVFKKNKANALIDPDTLYECGKVLLRFVDPLRCGSNIRFQLVQFGFELKQLG